MATTFPFRVGMIVLKSDRPRRFGHMPSQKSTNSKHQKTDVCIDVTTLVEEG